MIADETRRRRGGAQPICSPRPSTARTARRSWSRRAAALADEVLARTNGRVQIETGRVARGGGRGARTRSRPSTSSCSSPTRPRSRPASGTPAPCSSARPPSSATTRPARTTSCRPAAWPAARAGSAWRRSSSRCSSSAHARGPRRRPRDDRDPGGARGPAAARPGGRGAARERRGPLPAGFEPYVWASTAEEVARRQRAAPRRGDPLRRERPAAARRAAGAARRELRAAERVPGGHVPRAARGGRRLCRRRARSRSSLGAGADGLIGLAARTFLAPGRRAYVKRPTYPLYAIASGVEGAELTDDPADARPGLGLQPEQPDRRARRARRRSPPSPRLVRTPPSSSTRRTSSTAARRSSR